MFPGKEKFAFGYMIYNCVTVHST